MLQEGVDPARGERCLLVRSGRHEQRCGSCANCTPQWPTPRVGEFLDAGAVLARVETRFTVIGMEGPEHEVERRAAPDVLGVLVLIDANSFESTWMGYTDGKPGGAMGAVLSRQSAE
ncbi:MAG: hypothetical protein HC861_03380 [Rhodospirillaceae bacterium]|nr:hypothetical protein [Rhodospirillaceae bacterium]